MKKLYFEGAGCVPRADVSNCRIRTAFHLDDGRAVYLEISGLETTRSTAPCYSKFTNYGIIDHLHYIPGTSDDRADFGLDRTYAFEYTQANLLQLVNSLGASFDAVEVLHNLAGYRVHGDNCSYNFSDDFTPDKDLITARQQVDAWIRKREIARGERSICYSLWVDHDEPTMLHYKNFRTGEAFDICPRIPKDPTQLPVLQKSNAVPGCYYAFGSNGWQQLHRVYRISEEYARENELMYLDRCETSAGDFALPGSDVFQR